MPTVDLEQSLRADVDGYLERRLAAAREEIERLKGQLTGALSSLSESLSTDSGGGGDASLAVAISEHLRGARNKGIEDAAAESTRARASSDIAIIKAAIDDLEDRRSQSDVLSALVNRSASFAPRVAFFVVKNDRVTGWRARGLEGTVGDDSVREISLAVSSDTLLGEVARTRRTWSGAPGSHSEDKSIHGHFGEEPPQRIVAIPLVAREKAVAVLYADSAGQDAESINLEALETLVRVTGMAVELLALKRPQGGAAASAAEETATEQTAAAPEHQQQQPQPVSAGEWGQAPAPHAAAEPPSMLFAPGGGAAAAEQPSAFDTPAPTPPPSYEEQAPHQEQQPSAFAEPQPTFESAPAEAATPTPDPSPDPWTGRADIGSAPAEPAFAEPRQPSEPAAAPRRRYGADAALPIEVSDEERPLHDKARRFARLLVSEIKLYNEDKVKEGYEAGDLYRRLREHIDRSREMYDERYAHQVGGRYDYFHHELVNALAAGDSSKLGEGYPGERGAA